MTKTEKIIKHASQLYKAMDWLNDEEKKPLRVIITERSGKNHDELLDITFKVSKETSLSSDSVYEFTMNALGTIADSVATTQDELEELGYELEADVYTSDLTSWLNQSNNHVYYLTEVLEEYDTKDGFQTLALAQQKAKEEVYRIVLEELNN